MIANNGLNAGIVLPPEPWLSGTGSLVGHGSLCVSLDGRELGSGGLWPMPGGAEASVTWLRHHLAAHARELAAGDIVLTGTALDLYPVDRGGHVVGGIDGVAVVECRFA